MVTSKVIAALILLCGAGVAMCQGVIIQGVITDSDGQPIAGSVVTIEETETITITDQKGRYKISDIREGNYLIRVSAQAYRTQLRVITVSAGQTLDQDFVLQIDLQAMEQLVVTGTTAPEQKIESSTSISSLTTAELNDAAPRSTTEFLRRVPGFTRVESSGGEVNQNLSVRGLLGVTSVNLQEDGMVVYPTMEIFFMNADNLIRPDENLEEVEILRGGTSPIFGSSTAGATVNFLNKTGGTELEGVWKVTGGASGLARFDFNMNGPLADNWRFNIGGFYRYDHGVRDPGFP